MKASLNLIKKYVDLSGITTEEIVDRLTYSGLEVEDVLHLANATNLVIGKIIECVPHPDSDHLHVLKVDLGEKYGITQIVCGAPNAREGIKVIVSRVGAKLPGGEIVKSTIRGVESNGMCCALYELGVDKMFLSEKQCAGIEELPDDAVVGNENVLEYLGLDDTILDINVLANRSDCLAIFSLAKELSALFNRPLNIPEPKKYKELPSPLTCTSLTDDCKQFSLKMVKGVHTKPSPKWMSSFLMAHGIRSINNIVDIGNYVMILTGQPLHMYDIDKLPTKNFVVKNDIETDFVALDEKTYKLIPGDICITNGDTIGCLGGIMGALSCAVDDKSTNIVVESANFLGSTIRRTSIRTNLASDSSAHFIKGINPYQDEFVLDLTAELLCELADAQEVYTNTRYVNFDTEIKKIPCSYSYINKRLGTTFSAQEMNDVFNSLKIEITKVDEDNFLALPPAQRIDLKRDADLSEEIFRFIGLSAIKPTLPAMVTTTGGYTPNQLKKKRIRELLIDNGLHEVMTYTLVSPELDAKFVALNEDEAIKIKNPMTVDHSLVRRGTMASLMECLQYNLDHQNENIAIFEVSDVTTNKNTYQELGVALNGAKTVRGGLVTEKYDFYDALGIFEAITKLLGIEPTRYRLERLNNKFYHPGRTVGVYFGKDLVGIIGEVHPNYSKDIGETYIINLKLTPFYEMRTPSLKMKQVSKFPTIERDYAFVVDKKVLVGDMIRTIKKEAKGIIEDVYVFDIYEGEFLPGDSKSVALKVKFNSLNKTLKDEDINPVEEALIKSLNKNFGAYLRA